MRLLFNFIACKNLPIRNSSGKVSETLLCIFFGQTIRSTFDKSLLGLQLCDFGRDRINQKVVHRDPLLIGNQLYIAVELFWQT